MDPLLCFPVDLPGRGDAGAPGRRTGPPRRDGARRDRGPRARRPDARGTRARSSSPASDMTAAVAFCRHLRLREVPMSPLLLAIGAEQVGELLLRDDLYDDFCVLPARPDELVARLQHLFWRTGQSLRPDIIEYGPLDAESRDLPGGGVGPDPRPDLHGVRAAALPGRPPRQGLHPRDAAQPRLGLRVLRRRRARSTSTSGACGPSSARSTRT